MFFFLLQRHQHFLWDFKNMVPPLSILSPMCLAWDLFRSFSGFLKLKLEKKKNPRKIPGTSHLCTCSYPSDQVPSRSSYVSPPRCIIWMFTVSNRPVPDMTPLATSSASLWSFLKDTGARRGCPSDLHRQPAAPWGFLLRRAAQNKSSPLATGSEQNSAGKKEPGPRFPPFSPLCYSVARETNFLTAKGEGWKPFVTDLEQKRLQPSKTEMETCRKGGRTKHFQQPPVLSCPPPPAPLSPARPAASPQLQPLLPLRRWALQLQPLLGKPSHPAPHRRWD